MTTRSPTDHLRACLDGDVYNFFWLENPWKYDVNKFFSIEFNLPNEKYPLSLTTNYSLTVFLHTLIFFIGGLLRGFFFPSSASSLFHFPETLSTQWQIHLIKQTTSPSKHQQTFGRPNT